MSDRLNELEQLLLSDEYTEERASIPDKELNDVIREYRQLQEREQERVVAEIRRQHAERLQGELAQVEQELAAADDIEAEGLDDSTRWLEPAQLSEAQARAPFVKENMADLGPDDFVRQLRRVVQGEDRPLQWLYLRYGAGQWNQYEPAQKGTGLQKEYQQALQSLEEAVVPEEVRTAQERAHEQRLAAEKKRVELKSRLFETNGN